MDKVELLHAILKIASNKRYPDIHLTTSQFPVIRDLTGQLFELKEIEGNKIEIFKKLDIKNFIKEIAWELGVLKFEKDKELDTSILSSLGDRYRVNCYMDTAWYSIALRLIPSKIPTLEELWLWEQIWKMCDKNKWLILVTWPTWSGKSTNIAWMINYINKKYKKHIITIEDPVEFAFKSDKCLINQREVWTNTKSFTNAMRASLREDPDVIVIWEMRDLETIQTAITLAETWHLVLSTLHTNDSVQTIDRIVDVFPSIQQKQIRMQLSQSLIWIISQKLIPKKDWVGRVASREILIANNAVKSLIIEGKTHQLYSVLEVWKEEGMILMDKYLVVLYKRWLISKENVEIYARDKESVNMLIN